MNNHNQKHENHIYLRMQQAWRGQYVHNWNKEFGGKQ